MILSHTPHAVSLPGAKKHRGRCGQKRAVIDHGGHNVDIPVKGHFQEAGQPRGAEIRMRRAGALFVIRPNSMLHFAPFLSTHFVPRLNPMFKNASSPDIPMQDRRGMVRQSQKSVFVRRFHINTAHAHLWGFSGPFSRRGMSRELGLRGLVMGATYFGQASRATLATFHFCPKLNFPKSSWPKSKLTCTTTHNNTQIMKIIIICCSQSLLQLQSYSKITNMTTITILIIYTLICTCFSPFFLAQNYALFFPTPATLFIPSSLSWWSFRCFLVVFMKAMTLKCARLGSRAVV